MGCACRRSSWRRPAKRSPVFRSLERCGGGRLRVGILVLGLVGWAATYVAGRLLAGDLAGLVAVLLVATSWHYLHQSAILQADGAAVAISMLGLALGLSA